MLTRLHQHLCAPCPASPPQTANCQLNSSETLFTPSVLQVLLVEAFEHSHRKEGTEEGREVAHRNALPPLAYVPVHPYCLVRENRLLCSPAIRRNSRFGVGVQMRSRFSENSGLLTRGAPDADEQSSQRGRKPNFTKGMQIKRVGEP